MDKEYWLVNSNISKVKGFQKNKHNKDKFFEYIFIDSGKISGVFGQSLSIMAKREEWKKLLVQNWRLLKVVW